MELNQALILLLSFVSTTGIALGLFFLWGNGSGQKLRLRLDALRSEGEHGQPASLIREKYLRQLSPLERSLELLPGMAALSRLQEQCGRNTPAYRSVLLWLLLALVAGIVVLALDGHGALALLAALAALLAPLLRLLMLRAKRLEVIESQLADAFDLMTRALRAGTPLTEAFKFVSEEMAEPLASEFGTTWSHINYGVSLKGSLCELIERVPNVGLRSAVTAILVQRETGGNLAEVLEKIASVLRARAKFQRRVRTLTAEGRLSAWVLVLMPFALSALLAISAPTYLPLLTGDPIGRQLILIALTLMVVGILWIRRAVRIAL